MEIPKIPGTIDTIAYDANTDEFDRAQSDVNRLFESDIRWRLDARKLYARIFSLFLLIQNLFVMYIVDFSFRSGIDLGKLQLVLSVLIAGTIGQTVGVIQIMVKWIFSDINYNLPNRK